MDLPEARALKREIRDVLGHCRVALGISVAKSLGGCKVAVLPHTERDRVAVLPALAPFRSSIVVEPLTDVHRISGAAVPRRTIGPLQIGASLGHSGGGDGSLGFFAVQRSTGRRGIVSCNHTIALSNRGRDGDAILSPSYQHGGRDPGDVVAALDGRYPLLGATAPSPVDCAFASLADGVPYDASRVDGGSLVAEPTAANATLEVTKNGYATGTRHGVVTAIELDNVPVRYGTIKAFFNDVIQIESTSTARFAADGDSGALVYTSRAFQPVGLLFAASYVGGAYNAGYAWAHPIEQVMRALDVDLLVT